MLQVLALRTKTINIKEFKQGNNKNNPWHIGNYIALRYNISSLGLQNGIIDIAR